jgi:hypothetical protein
MGNKEWGTDVGGRDVDALWYVCTRFSNTSNIACIDTVGIFCLILFYFIFVVFAFLSFLSRVWVCRPSCRKLVQESTSRLTPSRVNPFCLLSIFIFLLHIILGVYNVGMRRRCRPCRYLSFHKRRGPTVLMLLHVAPCCSMLLALYCSTCQNLKKSTTSQEALAQHGLLKIQHIALSRDGPIRRSLDPYSYPFWNHCI